MGLTCGSIEQFRSIASSSQPCNTYYEGHEHMKPAEQIIPQFEPWKAITLEDTAPGKDRDDDV